MQAGRLVLALALLLLARLAAAEEKPVWLVVGRPGLVEAIAPLAEHRKAEGFEVVVSTKPPGEAIAAAPRPPSFILLVGDDEPGQEDAPWSLPAPRRLLYRWRAPQRETFEADALLGDLDGDLAPDVPVGRLPVRTAQYAAAAAKKILAYEDQTPTVDDLRLPVWGGGSGYGPQMDVMAAGMLLVNVRRQAPDWMAPWLLTAVEGTPLCGWPSDHPALFLRSLRRGGILGAMLAHGNEDLVVSMEHEGRTVALTSAAARAPLADGPPASPLVILACSCGRFSLERRGLAEELLALPGGPVAVVAATTESHPLTNYFTGIALLRTLRPGVSRLGPLWLESQRAAREASDPLVEAALKDVEGKLEETIDVEKLHRDQMLLYALLGDPATRLRMPEPLPATIERTETGWRWTAVRPEGATGLAVGLRPPGWPGTARAKEPLSADEARKRFEEANGRLEFAPLPAPAVDAPWTGEVTGKGRLRLAATGRGVLRVATFDLR